MSVPPILQRFTEPARVLDHGHVQLVDCMGSDADICREARQSYNNRDKQYTRADDVRLINRLMREMHTAPFEHAVIKVHVKAPIFVARQWFRHRTQSISEVSARYTELPTEFHVPSASRVSRQSTHDKQMSGEPMTTEEVAEVRAQIMESSSDSFIDYQSLLKLGVARETAREVLPVNTYTCWTFTQNVHNLLHFLALRLDEHAQYEIRVYAEALARIVQEWLPITWEAFKSHRLESIKLSGQQAAFVKALLANTDIEYLENLARLSGLPSAEFTRLFKLLDRDNKTGEALGPVPSERQDGLRGGVKEEVGLSQPPQLTLPYKP